MLLKNFFKKPEEKRYVPNNGTILGLLESKFCFSLNSNIFLRYYEECAPLFNAVNIVKDETSNIQPILKNKKNDDLIYEHPFLSLLNKPNPFTNFNLFFSEIVAFYMLTGNVYIKIIGNGKPLELSVIRPDNITIQEGSDGYPLSYNYSTSDGEVEFTRAANKRFYDSLGNEIIHLRAFNVRYGCDNLYGSSLFLGAELQICLYVLAAIHNHSLIKNQGRPSGLLTYKGDANISNDQVNEVKSLMMDRMSGPENTGKTVFLNGNFDWKVLSESIKDMDFPTLRKQTENTISKVGKIPLPLVNEENMTMSNYESARYALYDNAIVPMINLIYEFLDIILARYPNSENLELTFDKAVIPTLEDRKIKNTISAYEKGIISRNEARTEIGYEAVGGGDVFTDQLGQVVGEDIYIEDNRTKPAKSFNPDASYYEARLKASSLSKQKLFTDSEIEQNIISLKKDGKS